MPFDPNKFAEDLLKESKVDDTARKAVLAAFNDQAVNKKLNDLYEGQMRQADYSRKQAEAQDALKKAQDWYQNLTVWHQNKEAEFAARKDAGDPVTPLEDPDNQARAGLTKKEVDELLTQRIIANQREELGVLAAVSNLSFDYYKKFGEPLDTAGLIKKAQDERTNLQIAYERLIAPKVKEAETKDLEDRIKRERAEAAKEALANANIPSLGSLSSLAEAYPHPIDGLKPHSGIPKFGAMAAAKAHTDAILSGKRITGD